MQATKRKHHETAEKLETYEELFSMVENRDELGVAEIVRWIRLGHSPRTIVKHIKTDGELTGSNAQTLAVHTFLINLAHSTGSLRQIVRLAMAASTPTNSVQIPSPQVFRALCNRIVSFSYMEDMLHASPQLGRVPILVLNGAATSPGHDTQHRIASQNRTWEKDTSIHDSPPCRVPAMPWTTLTADDDAVSHLVSLFLAWINPTWRFVEADLFVMGNRRLILYRRPEVIVLIFPTGPRHAFEEDQSPSLLAFSGEQHLSYSQCQ
jgi:hypothetical protein